MAVKAIRAEVRGALQKVAAAALFALYSSQPALAAEIFTQTFETLGNCTTGREQTCWTDNGFTAGDQTTFSRGTIKGDGNAPLGSGYFEVGLPFGGASTGRVNINTTDTSEARWGFFVKFSDDYQFYTQTHGPGMRVTGSSGCDLGGNMEMGNDPAYYMFNNASCGFSNAIDLTANQTGRTTLKGGRWYWIEQYMKIDTSCSDSTSQTGCDGIYRMWVDGVLATEYTNRNFAGVTRSATISTFAYEWYFHVGMPGHGAVEPKAWIDNLIIRNDNVEIGIPGGATQGTANSTPYFVWHTANNFVAHQYNDCTLSSFTNQRGFNFGTVWRTNGNATSETATPSGHDGYPPDATECTSQEAATDAYMQISTATGDGGGAAFDRPAYYTGSGSASYYQSWVIHGWIYLPAGNDYSNVLLSGFRAYNCYSGCCDGSCAPWGRVIAMSVNGGNWAIAYRWDSGTSTYHTGSTAITTDSWVEFELWHDRTGEAASLKINGTEVVTADLTGVSQDIMQNPGGDGGGGVVVGVINYAGSGTFVAHYDDITVSSVSPTSCDGWESGTCPFAAEPDPAGNTGGAFIGKFY